MENKKVEVRQAYVKKVKDWLVAHDMYHVKDGKLQYTDGDTSVYMKGPFAGFAICELKDLIATEENLKREWVD